MKLTLEKTGLLLVGAALITNPLPGQYVLRGLDWAFQQMFIYGAWVTLVAGVYIVGLLFYYMWASKEDVVVPEKTKPTKKAGKYLLTD